MIDSTKAFADNPKTLKRQPTGSWKPVSAIGASRQTTGVDKMGSVKAEAIMAKIAALDKAAKKDMPSFEQQDRPEKAKEVFHALKEEHPEYSAGKKARIANAVAAGTVKH